MRSLSYWWCAKKEALSNLFNGRQLFFRPTPAVSWESFLLPRHFSALFCNWTECTRSSRPMLYNLYRLFVKPYWAPIMLSYLILKVFSGQVSARWSENFFGDSAPQKALSLWQGRIHYTTKFCCISPTIKPGLIFRNAQMTNENRGFGCDHYLYFEVIQ